jgi:hypothetical protein
MEPPAGAFSEIPLPPDSPPPDSPPPPPPRSTIPKTIGILNIVFGSVFLACAICSGINLLIQPAVMGPMMDAQQKQIQAQVEADRARQLALLKAQEDAAPNENEKAAIRARQKALQAMVVPKMPNFAKIAESPALQTFSIVDVSTGLVLNIVMLISGIGLLNYKEWGRITAIWLAVLKIIRLITIYTYYALVVVPDMVGNFNTMFKEMFDEIGKGAPPGAKMPGQAELDQIGTFMGIAMTATAVTYIIFGVIYPIITLVLLTRQRVKDACAAPAKRN